MSRVFKFVFSIFVMVLLVSQAQAKTDIEFLVDLSGSMKKVNAGETQIDSARKALAKALLTLESDTHTALRVYGHRVEQTDKAKSCEDTELVVPFSEGNGNAIKNAVQNLNPKGYTPIAYSLKQSKNDFSTTREAKKVIILLSDGEETCGGDPVAVVKELQAAGFDVVIHAIGFNVDSKTRAQLEAIAKAGNGQYYDAKNADELNKALIDATQEAAVIDKGKATYGEAIRGGDSYETAVALPLSKELKLDHHQKKKFYDYFYLDLEAGQEIEVTLKTLEKGIRVRGEEVRGEGSPYAGLEFHSNERKKLTQKMIIGKAFSSQILNYGIKAKGRYYIMIGNPYESQHKDHVTFQAKVISKGDLGTNKDAGIDMKTALPITPGRYEVNYIGGPDQKDVFKFDAKPGEKYKIGIIPNDDISAYFYVRFYDDFKMPVGSKANSPASNSGLKIAPFSFKEAGPKFMEVSIQYGRVDTFKSYTLIFQKTEASEE